MKNLRLHSWLMGAAFAFGVGSFVASTVYTDRQLRGIEAQTQAIVDSAVPAIVELSSLRAHLRDVDRGVEDIVGEHPGAADRVDRAMRAAERDFSAYAQAPPTAEDDGRGAALSSSFERIQQAVVDVRATVDGGDLPGARVRFENGLRFFVQQMDDQIATLINTAARQSKVAALEVATERRRARAVGYTLDGVSFAASLLFGLLVFVRIRRDERDVETRLLTAHA